MKMGKFRPLKYISYIKKVFILRKVTPRFERYELVV